MYTVRLQPAARQAASYAAVTAATATATASRSGSAHPSPSGTPRQDGTAAGVDEVDQIAFSAGNPRVEHLVGRVSLFRHLPPPGAVPASQQAAEHQTRQFQEPRKPGPSRLGRDVDPGPSANSASPPAAAADGAVEAQHVDLPVGFSRRHCICENTQHTITMFGACWDQVVGLVVLVFILLAFHSAGACSPACLAPPTACRRGATRSCASWRCQRTWGLLSCAPSWALTSNM